MYVVQSWKCTYYNWCIWGFSSIYGIILCLAGADTDNLKKAKNNDKRRFSFEW